MFHLELCEGIPRVTTGILASEGILEMIQEGCCRWPRAGTVGEARGDCESGLPFKLGEDEQDLAIFINEERAVREQLGLALRPPSLPSLLVAVVTRNIDLDRSVWLRGHGWL